ncbi:MAG: hypothetical protein NTV52_14000 [Acidobacteria bacterium]|nr:hypothetical protein [Acidobacteriota bacterium]
MSWQRSSGPGRGGNHYVQHAGFCWRVGVWRSGSSADRILVPDWRFSVIVNVEVPADIFARASEIAASQDLSVGDVFASACIEHIEAWERLESRAGRADRTKFLEVLAKVPDVEADEFDRF